MDNYNWDENRIRELDNKIGDFMDGAGDSGETIFNELAFEIFHLQYHVNEFYRKYCQQIGVNKEELKNWRDIPAIPTKAFRENIVASFPMTDTELALLTSGTTDIKMRGKIYRDKSSLQLILKANYLLTKSYLFPDVNKMQILLLVPSPKDAPGMPMAYGLAQAKQEFGTEDSNYYITPEGFQTEKLIQALRAAEEKPEPVCLMGATSGYVFFFNHCREKGLRFTLPKGSRVCDGGGYQGTFGACSREDFYSMVEEYLQVPSLMCVNILGMGESGTNYFDNVILAGTVGEKSPARYKVVPTWTRTVVVGVRTGQPLPKGEIGLIKHYDLTNRATVLAVQTDNLGYECEGGFEIVGRVNPKSATLGIESFNRIKDWVLGAGQEYPHGMTCSTVADSMMGKPPHGMPCSTVADAMINSGEYKIK